MGWLMRCPGLQADGDEPLRGVVQSASSLNYRRSNTDAMATHATFSKTKTWRAFSMLVGCDTTFCMADTGTISSGPVFISKDGCTVHGVSFRVDIGTQTVPQGTWNNKQ